MGTYLWINDAETRQCCVGKKRDILEYLSENWDYSENENATRLGSLNDFPEAGDVAFGIEVNTKTKDIEDLLGDEFSFLWVSPPRHQEIAISISRDADGYFAKCGTLEGCHTTGESIPEVMKNIIEAIDLYKETRKNES